MLNRLQIRNFKRLKDVTIELGNSVVLIGPNNSGKTSALQALTLWELGLRTWLAKRGDKASPEKRPGVAINRRDLTTVPAPVANLLWHQLHTRDTRVDAHGKKSTSNVRIEVAVDGTTNGVGWHCGFEFDYSNEESFVCRPARESGNESAKVSEAKFKTIPVEAEAVRVSYLPPMSGLADREFVKQAGEIAYLIGQGQTAQVLRNLCHNVHQNRPDDWEEVTNRMERLFGIRLHSPELLLAKSEIVLNYSERGVGDLDLSSAGKGAQQALLLLTHLYAQPGTVLLLDEPDAHLEILRQRQIFQTLSEVAESKKCQIITASHSEVVLNEGAGRSRVVAFVGKPHTINDHTSQVFKSLSDIGWDLYYQAELKQWMLFLEDSTDLAILRAFARRLAHTRAAEVLDAPFVHYLSTNIPQKARDLFYGLREAVPDLGGLALFDRLGKALSEGLALREVMWRRREIENYLCTRDALLAFAKGEAAVDLFSQSNAESRVRVMGDSIDLVANSLRILKDVDVWSPEVKASDEVLDPIFRTYFGKLGLPIDFRKADYHMLVPLLSDHELDGEVREKLDMIVAVADRFAPPDSQSVPGGEE